MTEEAIEILKKFKTKGYHMLYIKYGDRIKTNFKIEKAIDTVLNLTQKQQEELEKKDKTIDLMAKYINKILKDVLFKKGFEIELEKCTDNKIEEECIKEYFKKKAEEENERI